MPLHPVVGPSSVLKSGRPLDFIRLPHPRTERPTLFLPFPASGPTASPHFAGQEDDAVDTEGGILEVQAVGGSKEAEKSWFVMRDEPSVSDQVISDGKLVVLTPIDPLFVLLPLLIALSPIDPFAPTTSADVGRFESFDTMFDRAPTIWVSSADSGLSIDPKDVEAFTSFPFVRSTVARCCDTLEGGGDMFRLSKDKVLIALAQKVVRIVQSLEAAQAAIKAAVPEGKATQEEEQGYSGPRPLLVRLVEKEEGMGDVAGVPEAVMKDTRTKVALDIVCNYLPSSVASCLRAARPLPHLTAHLSASASTLASTSSAYLSVGYMPGRSNSFLEDEFDESGEKKALKKPKPAGAVKGSRGVEALKKVSTKGMSKLGDMWKKAASSSSLAAKSSKTSVVEDESKGKEKAKADGATPSQVDVVTTTTESTMTTSELIAASASASTLTTTMTTTLEVTTEEVSKSPKKKKSKTSGGESGKPPKEKKRKRTATEDGDAGGDGEKEGKKGRTSPRKKVKDAT